MHSTDLQVVSKQPKTTCQASCLVERHIYQLEQTKGEIDFSSFREVMEIVQDIIRDGYQNETSQNIIAYAFRLHLLSLAREEKLATEIFKNQRVSVQEICLMLYHSTIKFSSVRNKLRKVHTFLKPRNMQAFINKVAAQSGRSTRSKSPNTMRRAPHRVTPSFSYA